MPPTAADRAGPPAGIAAVWRAPLWAHAAALGVLLVLATFWAGTDTSFSMDEPAAIIQAQQLSSGAGWITPNPLPTIDPGEDLFYIVRSDQGTRGTAVYAKHAAYPLLLSVVDRLGGQTAMVLVSGLGTVAAALVAAAIARRLDERLTRWALWGTGIGSPLLFDSQLVIAHAPAAPLASGAALVLIGLRDRFRWPLVLAAMALVMGTSFLRTEGLLLAVALAGGCAVVAVRSRDRRWAGAAVGVLGAGLVTAVIDRWYVTNLVGAGVADISLDDGTGGFLQTRLPALYGMTLSPGSAWTQGAQAGLLLALLGALVLGFSMRTSPPRRLVLVAAAAVSAVGALIPLAMGPPGTIPSLLAACPLIAAGVTASTKRLLDSEPARWLGGVCLAYVAMVAVIQYGQGGGVEWGARFLAIIVPILVPLALLSLVTALAGVDLAARRIAVGGLVVGSLALGALGLSTIRTYHDNTRRFAATLSAAATEVPGPDLGDGDRRPIVVSTWFVVGRLTTGKTVPVRGLSVINTPLAPVVDRLRDAGVTRFVLVLADPAQLAELHGRYRVVPSPSRPEGGPVHVVEAT